MEAKVKLKNKENGTRKWRRDSEIMTTVWSYSMARNIKRMAKKTDSHAERFRQET